MIVLAIDTCDSKGSVALMRDEIVLKVIAHEALEDYSSWVLPTVSAVLEGSGIRMEDVEVYTAAAGPGSFTGVRIALTTVKAWSEVYGKPIVALSRLRALAREAKGDGHYVSSFANAQRGQVFGAVYRRDGRNLVELTEEMVIRPGKYLETAEELCGGESIAWVSTEPECVLSEAGWKERELCGEKIERISSVLAPVIGRMGLAELAAGRFTNALALDANYVRRTDAVVSWKDGSAHGH